MKKKFEPTPEMISAGKAVLMSMAFTQTIRPIVEGYQKKILDEMKPVDRYDNTPITDIKYAWTMPDDQFLIFDARCKEERNKAGLIVENDDFCPLLVAEDLQRKAEHCLIETMRPITGLTLDNLLCSKDGLENLKKYLDLTLRLLAPFVGTAQSILAEA